MVELLAVVVSRITTELCPIAPASSGGLLAAVLPTLGVQKAASSISTILAMRETAVVLCSVLPILLTLPPELMRFPNGTSDHDQELFGSSVYATARRQPETLTRCGGLLRADSHLVLSGQCHCAEYSTYFLWLDSVEQPGDVNSVRM